MSVMNLAESPVVACSAPGKVLLAGGYLVLDREYTGLVFGLDARIHVLVNSLPEREGLTFSDIIVRSPQFRDAEWRYQYTAIDGGGIRVKQVQRDPVKHQSENRFVQTTLTYALSYASCLYGAAIQPAVFTILADTDYYSKSPPKTTPEWQSTRFHNFNVPLTEAHKTGLGSSAALVTAFAHAALAYFVPLSLKDAESKEGQSRLHNLAQAAHCAAQGKVGSGFDVAAAVYGSCVYRRFSPRILENLSNDESPDFARRLQAAVEDSGPDVKWDVGIDKTAAVIPDGLLLVMCDVDCGSGTVGMVKSILQWRREKPQECGHLWTALQMANEDLAAQLRNLSSKTYFPPDDIERLQKSLLTIRSFLRCMTKETGVPIEPPAQTALIDACCSLPGVIGGVVPGAGGYDAVALLIENKAEVVRDLRSLLSEYQAKHSEDDGIGIGGVRLLGVKQEAEGIRIEDPEDYGPWINKL